MCYWATNCVATGDPPRTWMTIEDINFIEKFVSRIFLLRPSRFTERSFFPVTTSRWVYFCLAKANRRHPPFIGSVECDDTQMLHQLFSTTFCVFSVRLHFSLTFSTGGNFDDCNFVYTSDKFFTCLVFDVFIRKAQHQYIGLRATT